MFRFDMPRQDTVTYDNVSEVWQKVLTRLSSASAKHDNAVDFFLHYNRDRTGINICKHAFEVVHSVCHPRTNPPTMMNRDENQNLCEVMLQRNTRDEYLIEGLFSGTCPSIRWAYDWADSFRNTMAQRKIPDYDVPNTKCFPENDDGDEKTRRKDKKFKILLWSVRKQDRTKSVKDKMIHKTTHTFYEYLYLPTNIASIFCNTYLPYYEDTRQYAEGTNFANTHNLNEAQRLMFEHEEERLFGLPHFNNMSASVKGIMAKALQDSNSANAESHPPAADGERTDLEPRKGRPVPAPYIPFCTHVSRETVTADALTRYNFEELFDIRNFLGFYKQYKPTGAAAGATSEYSILGDRYFENYNLEPWFAYWERNTRVDPPNDSPAIKRLHTGRLQQPDLMLQVEYTTTKGPRQRVIVLEADGQDKTTKGNKGPAKMALKDWQTMSLARTNQNSAYILRSNVTTYNERSVNERLLQTSNFEKNDISALVKKFTVSTDTETKTLYQSLCLMHDMLAAHAWVALIIYYRETHNFDIRTMAPTTDNEDMYFFINHPAMQMPTCNLSFVNNATHTEQQITAMAQERQIQNKPRVAFFDGYVTPPLMSTSNKRCLMHNWYSRFERNVENPFEVQLCVRTVSFTLRHVRMSVLTTLITKSAQEALDAYLESKICKKRGNVWRREHADLNYFTRKEQEQILMKSAVGVVEDWGNYIPNGHTQRLENDPFNDNAHVNERIYQQVLPFSDDEYNFSFRLRGQDFEFSKTPQQVEDSMTMKTFDDIDLRIFYFMQAMEKNKWREKVEGMWYVMDINEFLQCISDLRLTVKTTPSVEERYLKRNDYNDTTKGKKTLHGTDQFKKFQSELKKYIISPAYLNHNSPVFDNSKSEESHFCENVDAFHRCGDITIHDPLMPVLPDTEETRRMRFGIVSAFFDCRDGGMCGYMWEDWLMMFWNDEQNEDLLPDTENPDATATDEPETSEKNEPHTSGNHQCIRRQMSQKRPDDKTDQSSFFDNCWFRMLEGIEVEFRNMLSYGLRNLFKGTTGTAWNQWNKMEKEMHALLRARPDALSVRSQTQGPLNVMHRLSVPSNLNKNNLRNMLIQQCHKDIPQLDPVLAMYVDEWKCPDMYLWLQLAGVPNVLALHQLGKQYVAGTAPATTTKYFPFLNAGTVSEIDAMLRFVANDRQVFISRALPTPSKLVVMPSDLITELFRKVLGLPSDLEHMQTPLQYKLHMVLDQHHKTFTGMFGTHGYLNLGPCRPIIFSMLQVSLLQHILTHSRKDALMSKKAFWNDELLMLCQGDEDMHRDMIGRQFEINRSLHQKEYEAVYCTIGCSADTWPARDSNQVFWSFTPNKHQMIDLDEAEFHSYCFVCDYVKDNIMPVTRCRQRTHESGEYRRKDPETGHLLTKSMTIPAVLELNDDYQYEIYDDEMSDEADGEKCMWQLLINCRPHMQNKPVESKNILQLLNATRKKPSKGLDTFTAIYEPLDHKGSVQVHESYVILDKLPADVVPPASSPLPATDIFKDSEQFWDEKKGPDNTPSSIYVSANQRSSLPENEIYFSTEQGSHYIRRFVGVRCWAWKRLHVKAMLLYTCSQALTHCRELTALFLPSDQEFAVDYQTFEQVGIVRSCWHTVTTDESLFAINRPENLQTNAQVLQQAVEFESPSQSDCADEASNRIITTDQLFRTAFAEHAGERDEKATQWPNIKVVRRIETEKTSTSETKKSDTALAKEQASKIKHLEEQIRDKTETAEAARKYLENMQSQQKQMKEQHEKERNHWKTRLDQKEKTNHSEMEANLELQEKMGELSKNLEECERNLENNKQDLQAKELEIENLKQSITEVKANLLLPKKIQEVKANDKTVSHGETQTEVLEEQQRLEVKHLEDTCQKLKAKVARLETEQDEYLRKEASLRKEMQRMNEQLEKEPTRPRSRLTQESDSESESAQALEHADSSEEEAVETDEDEEDKDAGGKEDNAEGGEHNADGGEDVTEDTRRYALRRRTTRKPVQPINSAQKRIEAKQRLSGLHLKDPDDINFFEEIEVASGEDVNENLDADDPDIVVQEDLNSCYTCKEKFAKSSDHRTCADCKVSVHLAVECMRKFEVERGGTFVQIEDHYYCQVCMHVISGKVNYEKNEEERQYVAEQAKNFNRKQGKNAADDADEDEDDGDDIENVKPLSKERVRRDAKKVRNEQRKDIFYDRTTTNEKDHSIHRMHEDRDPWSKDDKDTS